NNNTYTRLEANLKSYIRGQETKEIPTVRYIVQHKEVVIEKAQRFINNVSDEKRKYSFKIMEDIAKIGGGTMPEVEIETYIVQVKHPQYTSAEIAERLRKNDTPIIVRVKNDVVILDFRTIDQTELEALVEAFTEV